MNADAAKSQELFPPLLELILFNSHAKVVEMDEWQNVHSASRTICQHQNISSRTECLV
jgi:hypothetical protein